MDILGDVSGVVHGIRRAMRACAEGYSQLLTLESKSTHEQ